MRSIQVCPLPAGVTISRGIGAEKGDEGSRHRAGAARLGVRGEEHTVFDILARREVAVEWPPGRCIDGWFA
jgi:hypothetical protein